MALASVRARFGLLQMELKATACEEPSVKMAAATIARMSIVIQLNITRFTLTEDMFAIEAFPTTGNSDSGST